MVNLFAHVARNKAAYLITAIIAVLLGVSALSYNQNPDPEALGLAGQVSRLQNMLKRPSTLKKSAPVAKPGIPTPPPRGGDTSPDGPSPTPPAGPAPDLIVESIEVRPAPASHPDYYQYFATLKNIGDAGTTEQVWTYFERLNGALTSLDGTRVNVYTDPLAAGESRTVSMGIAPQCVASAMATEHMKAKVDEALRDGRRVQLIAESNEDNNILQISWPADLARCATPTPGTLNIAEYTSPQSRIVVAGTTRQLVAQYGFNATGEGFDVTKLTIINDATGSFETPVDTIAVSRVQLEYPDRDGVFRTVSRALTGGATTFSDLDMVARQDAVVPVRIYADVMSTDWGQTLSGQTFRLGIKENNADADGGTFSAVGNTSGAMEYNPVFTGGSNVNFHVVRFSQPFVAKEGGDEALSDGAKNLYAVRVTADAAGPRGIEVKRIMFTLDVSFRDPSDDLKRFRVRQGFDGDDLLPEEASISGESFTGTNVTDLYACSGADCWDAVDGNTANGSSLGHVVVNFGTARSVSAGSSRIFVLRAEVFGANTSGERVATFIPADTGGLSTVPVASLPDMVTSFIWSDNSSTSPAHSETTSDWTNGYLVNTLPTAAKEMSY